MDRTEIKEYLKRTDELELKLTGEDKDTFQWVLFGYNECARLLNEKEQENQQLKDKFKELEKWLEAMIRIYENEYKDIYASEHYKCMLHELNSLKGENNG